MNNIIIHREDSLAHYGIVGQKWGIRRYQNEDGSYKSGAEGRYAQTSSRTKGYERAERNSPKYSGSVKRSGGGGSVSEEDEEKKKYSRKDIHIYDVSEKLPEKGSKEKKSGSGGGRGGGKSKSSEKESSGGGGGGGKESSGNEEKVYLKDGNKIISKEELKKENSSFSPDTFYEKINSLKDLNELTAADRKQIEEMIKQYSIYKASNKKETKKTKLIDDFIRRYYRIMSIGLGRNPRREGPNSSENESGSADQISSIKYRNINKKNIKHNNMNENLELYHYGVLGMKWGIRRYQNEDGSLTAAGKKRYRTDDDLNDKGETRKGVIDRLNKSAEKNEKLKETYYNKSDLKKDRDQYDNSYLTKSLWGLQHDPNKGFYYDSEKGYEQRLEYKKKTGKYSEDKDTNLKRSRTYENKAYRDRSDAQKLGKHYQRNKTITDALVSSMGAALLTSALGGSGKKAAKAALLGGLAGASIGSLVGYDQRNKTEEKYGFKRK